MKFPEGHLNLFVAKIDEPAVGQLRIVVAEGMLGDIEPIEFADIDLGEVRPIQVTDESRFFEIIWPHYVAYAVRNESYWKAEKQEPPFSKHLYRRFDSAFLAFVDAATFADDDYPGPLQHWALDTLNHCVDVVSVNPPSIKQIKSKLSNKLTAPKKARPS